MKKIIILSMCLSAFLFADNQTETTPCNNISALKTAVAKLITEQEKIKAENVSQQKEIDSLKNILIQKENKVVENKLKELPVKIESKHNCVTKKIKEVNQNEIQHSFLKMNEKEFHVASEKAFVYEYPVLDLQPINELSRGEKFTGDMYTVAGWVHNKDGGWLKGYILNPKVEYDTNANYDSKNSAYTIKEVVECEGDKK